MIKLKNHKEWTEFYWQDEMCEDLLKILKNSIPISVAEKMRNELCLKCGNYKKEHLGACNGCIWRESYER